MHIDVSQEREREESRHLSTGQHRSRLNIHEADATTCCVKRTARQFLLICSLSHTHVVVVKHFSPVPIRNGQSSFLGYVFYCLSKDLKMIANFRA